MNSSAQITAELDEDGVHLSREVAETLTIELEGRRLWSFKTERDGTSRRGEVLVPWPDALRPRLKGTGRLTLRIHTEDIVLFDGPVRFGDSDEPLLIEDDHGHPLEIMKTGRLTRSYADGGGGAVEKVVNAALEAQDFIVENTDLTVFLAFGGLLGAVREGKVIGHDNDLDLTVVYPQQYPVDVIRRSFQLERQFIEAGWYTHRYSAAAFKVARSKNHGASELIDLFGAFEADGQLYFMPNLSAGRSGLQLEPVSSVMLEGREFRAPHDISGWLEMIYGPTWRIPDPGWKYEPVNDTRRRVSGWTRAAIDGRRDWYPYYSGIRRDEITAREESGLAHWAADRLPAARLVDVGCGAGQDAVWLAGQGFEVMGIDFAPTAVRWTKDRARKADVKIEARRVNVLETHHMLALGSEMAFAEGPCHVYVRRVIETLNDRARVNLWRFASMATRSGGRLVLEFRTPSPVPRRKADLPGRQVRRRPEAVRREIEAAGGRIEHEETVSGRAAGDGQDKAPVCRMIVSWS